MGLGQRVWYRVLGPSLGSFRVDKTQPFDRYNFQKKNFPSRFHSACFDPDCAYGGVGIGILVQRNLYEPITS